MWTEDEVWAERDRTREELELLLHRKAGRRTAAETLLEVRQLKAEVRELDRTLVLYQAQTACYGGQAG